VNAGLEVCPSCGSQLARPDTGPAWCPSCEWNLGAYDRSLVAPKGWGWLDRLSHRLAFQLDQHLFRQYVKAGPGRLGLTPARILLTLISLALIAFLTGCVVGGAWLMLRQFPSWSIVPGAILILIAIGLRPRMGRLPRTRFHLHRDRAPTLFRLVDQIVQVEGAKVPQIVAVERDYNASLGRVGWRQGLVLTIGVPLWITLSPSQRVALLAHEIAHEINGDPQRGLLTWPALSTFGTLANVAAGNKVIGDILLDYRPHVSFLQIVVELWLWGVSRVFLLIHLGLLALGMRDHQRAEYLADWVAADVAGVEATRSLLDRLVILPQVITSIGYNAPTTGPEQWQRMASSLHMHNEPNLPLLRQLSQRAASIWRSHPPAGLRARMMLARQASERPMVLLTDEDSARIDEELAPWYAATHRHIVGTRDTTFG
jgi:heat shock protein HtpX